MEYINFTICFIIFLLGLLMMDEVEDFAVVLICLGIVGFVIHGITFKVKRNEHYDFVYEVIKHHRRKDLTPEEQDSINEKIHYLKYENDFWLEGQYIPDTIDTLTLFNHKEDKQWEQIIDSDN
jgi:hypothetical protein